MFRSSTTHARRFLLIAFAALGVLTATGCAGTNGASSGASFPTDLDNPIHNRTEAVHVAYSFPATSNAAAPESHGAPGRAGHLSAVPR
jgi:hypothetical protein